MLNLVTKEVGKVGANEVRVRWMGAPINPSDINQLQGVYPIKPPLPAVGGMEGFGEVEEVIFLSFIFFFTKFLLLKHEF